MNEDKDNQTDVHNNFFHNIMKEKKNAIDFLKFALPKDISSKLDFSDIYYDDTSYIQKRFKKKFSDMVVKLENNHEPCDVYILIEHKSSYDNAQDIFMQLLHYIYCMFEHDNKNGDNFRNIIPLVFYHGKNEWKVPLFFSELYKCNDSLKKYLLNFTYVLFNTEDFVEENEKSLKNNIMLLSTLIAFKTAFDKKELDSIVRIIRLLDDAELLNNFEKIRIIINYIFYTNEVTEEELNQLIKNEVGGEAMTTVLDKYIDIGREEGKEKGIEEGVKEGKKEDAIAMLIEGFSIEKINRITGLSFEEISELKGN